MSSYNNYVLNTCYKLHVCVSQILNGTQIPNVTDSNRRWGPWQVSRSWGQSLLDGISDHIRRDTRKLGPPCTLRLLHVGRPGKGAFTSTWQCWHRDLGFPGLQNCDKQIWFLPQDNIAAWIKMTTCYAQGTAAYAENRIDITKWVLMEFII